MKHGGPLRACDRVFELAEGPVWDPATGRVLWVDILDGSWFEGELVGDGIRAVESHQHVDEFVGAVFPTSTGRRVIAGRRRIWLADGPAVIPARRVIPDGHDSRTNDCAIDPSGRLLVGTVSTRGILGHDLLERIEHDGALTVLDDDLSCSNGLAWSADGRLLYSTDSAAHRIHVREYDPSSGSVGSRRVHIEFGDEIPDGVCIDVEDHLWVAIWGAGEVRRFGPDGRLDRSIRIPVPLVSSVAFIGQELDTLLVTTARENLSPAQLAEFPDSGSLYIVRPGIRGIPTPAFRESPEALARTPAAGC
jgi:sugar lactone lactonase YvrE